MAHKIIKYKCDFCRKSFMSKSYAEKQHEPVCFYNPKRKGCITCNNFYTYEYDTPQHCGVNIDISNKLKVECYSHKLKQIK